MPSIMVINDEGSVLYQNVVERSVWVIRDSGNVPRVRVGWLPEVRVNSLIVLMGQSLTERRHYLNGKWAFAVPGKAYRQTNCNQTGGNRATMRPSVRWRRNSARIAVTNDNDGRSIRIVRSFRNKHGTRSTGEDLKGDLMKWRDSLSDWNIIWLEANIFSYSHWNPWKVKPLVQLSGWFNRAYKRWSRPSREEDFWLLDMGYSPSKVGWHHGEFLKD